MDNEFKERLLALLKYFVASHVAGIRMVCAYLWAKSDIAPTMDKTLCRETDKVLETLGSIDDAIIAKSRKTCCNCKFYSGTPSTGSCSRDGGSFRHCMDAACSMYEQKQ
jgi:hypothetical protein